VNKNPTDATVCRYLFTAKLLYMFRASQHPSSGVLKTVPTASGTSSMTCTLMHGTTSLKFYKLFNTSFHENLLSGPGAIKCERTYTYR